MEDNNSEEKNLFSQPWKSSDAVLLVEKKKLHVHTSILSMASPVFDRMFNSHSKESATKEVNLEGKKYIHIKSMLEIIYPQASCDFPRLELPDLKILIDLSNEYDIDSIKKRVEAEIINPCYKHIQSSNYEKKYKGDFKGILELLVIADYGNFENAVVLCARQIGNSCLDYGLERQNNSFAAKFEVKSSANASTVRKHIEKNSVSVKTKLRLMGEIVENDSEKLCSECRATKSELRYIATHLKHTLKVA